MTTVDRPVRFTTLPHEQTPSPQPSSTSKSTASAWRWPTTSKDARAYAAYGQNSQIGRILEIQEEPPGRIHVVLVRQSVGF